MDTIPKKQAVKAGWEALKKNWKIVLLSYVVFIAVVFVLSLVSQNIPSDVWYLSTGVSLGSSVFQWICSLGFFVIFLSAVDGKPAVLKDLFSRWKLVLWFLIGSIIVTGLTIVGLILLIIPGIIIGIRLQFWGWAMADGQMGAIPAIKKSWNMTAGRTMDLFVFDLLLVGVNIVGLLALGFGLIITVPVTNLATAWVYRRLSATG